MARGILSLLLIAIGLPAWAQSPPAQPRAADAVDVINFMDVLRAARANPIELSCNVETGDPALFFDLRPGDPGENFETRSQAVTPQSQRDRWNYQCAPMQVDNFCRAANAACTQRTLRTDGGRGQGSQDCWRWGSHAPSGADPRENSQAVRRRTMTYAAQVFQSIKDDPGILDKCCGPDRACRSNFRSTHLEFLDGLPRHDRTAHYTYDPDARHHNLVQISTSYLMNALTTDFIDWILLHEMGHACQFSKVIAMPAGTEEEATGRASALRDLWEGTCSAGVGVHGYITGLGFETGACIRDRLRESVVAARARGLDACLSQWEEEAFATSVFSFRMNALEQWAWPCRNSATESHPEQEVYMQCLLNDPNVSRNFCGS